MSGILEKQSMRMQSVDSSTKADLVQMAPDARQNVANTSVLKSTSGSISALTSVPMPSEAIGFVIIPQVNDVRFAVNEDPEAVGDLTANPITFGVGAVAQAGLLTVRVLGSVEAGTTRTLRILPPSATTVYVEFF